MTNGFHRWELRVQPAVDGEHVWVDGLQGHPCVGQKLVQLK